jgi:hypothetical protein
VQARVMGYPPDSVKIHDKRSPPASNYPRLDNAWDARVSAGFSVGSGFVKAQFSGRDLIFLRTFGNTNEMYDESERQFTLAMGLTF